MKFKILVLSLLLALISTSGLGCRFLSSATQEALKPVTLEYWRVWDDRTDFSDIIAAYQSMHPNVKINYRKLRYEEYEQALVEAFAAGKGPDIFSIHNTWIKNYQSFIQPMPSSITLPYRTMEGLIKKQEVIKLATNPTISIRDFKNNFVDLVSSDVLIKTKVQQGTSQTVADLVYGVPYSLDTLALFYNKDMLNNAGIVGPPATWTEFQEDVMKITKLDEQGNIAVSGAAIGTGSNVGRSPDILALLMMQNGAQMTDQNGNPTFNIMPENLKDRSLPPGQEALKFYTDFASPVKEVYTWNAEMGDSLDAFAAGKTAFMFGYSYHIEQLLTKAPKLNYKIAALPQLDLNVPINYANYWMETVSNKTKNINEAWDFLLFASSKDQVSKYLNKTKKPTALKSLIEGQMKDDNLMVFASQILTAKDWYRGEDANAMEQIFIDMIDNVVSGSMLIKDAVETANSRVKQTMNVKKPYEF